MICIKVIILAAGIGSRLGHNLPKALVELRDGFTILDLQLELLKERFNIEDIIVVVGYKKNLIMEKYPELGYMYNSEYGSTNTSKSLLHGLNSIEENEDVLWLNGDVVFESGILDLVLEKKDSNVICVNNEKVSDEEVKYTLDDDGFINVISKGVVNGLGEAVGINFIKKEYLPLFISCLEKCQDDDYFEKGIEMAIDGGVKFIPVDIKDNFCIEVDFQEDLQIAKKFYKRLEKNESINNRSW